MKALLIPADSDSPIRELRVDTLEDYQATVGGWIEPIDIPALGVTVYVNEEGLLRHLPLNSRALFLWWYFVPEARQKAMLVGPAIVVGLPDRSGSATNIPSEVAKLLLKGPAWRVEVKVRDDQKWYQNETTHSDFFEALVWAMVTVERWTVVEDTRVVPVPPGEFSEEQAVPPVT